MTFIHHKTLTKEKWSKYPFYKQLLMIANELNRAKNMIAAGDFKETGNCYERAFELIDVTVALLPRRNILRELLRLRDVMAGMYSENKYIQETNTCIYNSILSFTPQSYLMLN